MAFEDSFGYDGEDIMGEDDGLDALFEGDTVIGSDDLIGAVKQAAKRHGVRNVLQALGNVPKAALVKRAGADRLRRQSAGIPVSAAIPVGDTYRVELKPQRKFRIDDLYFPDTVAQSFELTAATVEQVSQIVAGGAVPLAGFSHLATRGSRHNLIWDTAEPGVLIELAFTNIGAAPMAFRGEARGLSVSR